MFDEIDPEIILALYRFLGSSLLLLVSIGLVLYKKMGLEKDLIISTIRGFVQLLLLASALVIIFTLSNYILLFGVLTIMILFGAHTAAGRLNNVPDAFYIEFVGLGTAVYSIMIFVSVFKIIPINDAAFWIPIGGMVVGNSMNASYLSVNRLRADLEKQIQQVEAALSLGIDPYTIMSKLEITSSALRVGIIPRVNNLRTLGLVFIPGLMTGLLIGGMHPIAAAFYQVLIFFLIIAGGLIGGVITTHLAVGKLFDLQNQSIKYWLFDND